MVYLLDVLYDEDLKRPPNETYRGCSVRRGAKDTAPLVFNTGDPTLDYATATAAAFQLGGPKANVFATSGPDNFVMDGGSLEWTPGAEVCARAVSLATEAVKS